ncbi:MAG TPA: hypothetical protein DCL60_04870, partial [Armatimonadetes bacterium]|nr:hypothetical protein [Armatimonadota bacterium]
MAWLTKPELNTGLARDQVTPLFYQLVNVLRDSVKEMEDGSRFSTERELSLQYGVSRGTVVRAINQLVDEGYLYRIQGKGTFVRQKIVPSKSHNILIILPKPIREYIVQKNYIMADMLQGVMDEASSSSKLLMVNLPKGANETVFCIDRMTDSLVDGVVLLAYQGLSDIFAVAEREKIPFVLVNIKSNTYYNRNNVLAKETEGIKHATQYLISLGHKRIAFLGPRVLGVASIADRYLGYEQAMAEAGLPVTDARHELALGIYNEEKVAELFESSEQPTAIVAANDYIAMDAINAIKRMGLTVPGDVSVMGYDDIPPAGAFTPALTTVREPMYEIGCEVIRYLVSLIDNGYSVQGCRT